MKLLLALSLAIAANATVIPPGPVWSGLPEFAAPCSGYELGPQPFGCITGETRTVSALGEVIAGYLRPTPLADPAPLPPAIVPPVVIVEKAPVTPDVPLTSAAPEPHYLWLTVAALLVAGFWKYIAIPESATVPWAEIIRTFEEDGGTIAVLQCGHKICVDFRTPRFRCPICLGSSGLIRGEVRMRGEK